MANSIASIYAKYGLTEDGKKQKGGAVTANTGAALAKNAAQGSAASIYAKYGLTSEGRFPGEEVRPLAAPAPADEQPQEVKPVSRLIEESNAQIRYKRAWEKAEADKHSVNDIYSNDFAVREQERQRRERNEQQLAEAEKTLERLGMPLPTSWERAAKLTTGAGKTYAGNAAGAAGNAVYGEALRQREEKSGEIRAWQDTIDAYREVLNDPKSSAGEKKAATDVIADLERRIAAYNKAYGAGGVNEQAAETVNAAADRLTASGSADIERGKEGLGTAGNLAANAYVAGVQMAADKGLGMLTGTGAMLPMMVRSFGGGVQEARNKGYSHEQQLALGLTNAATEYFSEQLFGGNPVYDADVGLVNRAINAAVRKFGGTDAAARVMSVLGSTAMETLNEGWEEVVSDLLNPMWEQLATGNRSEASLQELAEDWLVGVILGGIGQTGKAVGTALPGNREQGPRELRTAEQIAAEPPAAGARVSDASAAEGRTGNLTTVANGAAETQKTAFDEAEEPRYLAAPDAEEMAYVAAERAAIMSEGLPEADMSLPKAEAPERRTATGAVERSDVEAAFRGPGSTDDLARQQLLERRQAMANGGSGEPQRAETGKPYRATLYHGSGKSAAEIYNGLEYPVVGKGTYWAPSETLARNYGDNIETQVVELKNPLVIADDADWWRLTRAAGWEYPNTFGLPNEERIALSDALRKYVLDLGHDGLVIQYDSDHEGDINIRTQQSVRTLDNMFGHDQIIQYSDNAQTQTEAEGRRSDQTARQEETLPLPAPEVTEQVEEPRSLAAPETEEKLLDMLPQGSVAETPMDEYNARNAGYPIISGVQVVPFKTYVQASDRGNYGLVVGQAQTGNGEPRLWVNFWNKDEDIRATVAMPVSMLKPVKGRYSMTMEESAAFDEALERIGPEELNNLPSEEEMRERQGWYDKKSEKSVPFSPVDPEMMPQKAKDYLRRAERTLVNKIADALDVPRFADRSSLQSTVEIIGEEYLRNGHVSKESVDSLFEQAYEQGIVTSTEMYDQYKDIKDRLRTTSVSISEEDAKNIPDFNDFRKSAFGTLRIGKNGTPVEFLYANLREQAPELFPADITQPAEQLRRMYEVGRSIQKIETDLDGHYGGLAEEFKAFAKNDFQAAINETVAELNRVKRYADEQKAAKPVITEDTVNDAFNNIRQARKKAERVKARNLLTAYDNAQVARLLKGEITLDDLDAGKANVKGIREVYEAQRDYDRYAEAIGQYNKQRKSALLSEADGYLETANDWKDKGKGILYSRETMERNIRDIVPDRALADRIVERYFRPVHDAQAESTRFKNAFRDRVRALDLSRKVEYGNTVSEAHAVQLLGEAEDNVRVLNENSRAGEKRDGKTAEEWQAAIRELWEQNPKLDRTRIESAVKEFRGIYDELFAKMNEVRVRNGYEPVGYRQGYFPHFQPGETEGVMAMFGKALGIDTAVTSLPTSINGLTHTFRPGITWFGSAQERLGFDTAYDAVEGFDRYIEGVSDVIHQTDNIQRLRALAAQVRYRTTDDGMREQIDAIRENQNLDEEEKRDKLNELYQDGRFALGNFVVELEEYTNLLANKKSKADRNMEQMLGRRMYNIMKGLESRVAANMVAVNPGSWLTNFIPLTQGWATLDTRTLLRGMGQTLKAYKSDDGMVARSSFLTNRRGSDPIVRTWAQEATAKLASPMEYIDRFTADSLVRARYMQNVRQGLSEETAISEADAWAAGIMADRSKGSMPTLFGQLNPLTKLFTQFQLEVNNQFSNLIKDVPDELKKKGLGALAAGLLKFFVGAFLYNEIYEYVVGRRAAFDPIGILNDTVGDLTGYELPNLIEGAQGLAEGAGADIFKTEKKSTYDTVTNFEKNVAEEIPFVGSWLGGGRLPISSALPSLENLKKAAAKDQEWSGKKRAATAAKELSAPLLYIAPPFGGGQLKKIYQGLSAVARGGSYSIDAQGNDILQYPVFNDTGKETAEGLARALLFGKSSFPEAREWVESGFDSFSAKETAVYQGLNDAGVSDRDAYALLSELGRVKKTDEESANEIKRRILRESDISGEGKSVVYYGLLASEKERGMMDELAGHVEDMGAATETLIQLKEIGDLKGADKAKVKYQALIDSEMTERGKREVYRTLISDSYEEVLDELKKSGVGFDAWLAFERDTAGFEGEKDKDGKTIQGTKKAKVLDSIDAMGLTVEQKDALYIAAGYTESTIGDAPWRMNEFARFRRETPGVSSSYELPKYELPKVKLQRYTLERP